VVEVVPAEQAMTAMRGERQVASNKTVMRMRVECRAAPARGSTPPDTQCRQPRDRRDYTRRATCSSKGGMARSSVSYMIR
jgi:hypothetical protein